jgi:hypothetical protein
LIAILRAGPSHFQRLADAATLRKHWRGLAVTRQLTLDASLK